MQFLRPPEFTQFASAEMVGAASACFILAGTMCASAPTLTVLADNSTLAERIGRAMGSELSAVGIDMNLAPLVCFLALATCLFRVFGTNTQRCCAAGRAQERRLRVCRHWALLQYRRGCRENGGYSGYSRPAVCWRRGVCPPFSRYVRTPSRDWWILMPRTMCRARRTAN
jgi:hypothetical protein